MKKTGVYLLSILCLLFAVSGCTEKKITENAAGQTTAGQTSETKETAGNDTVESELPEGIKVEKDGAYTSCDEVALYIHTYGELPDNFITKKEAQSQGWESKEGNLDKVAPGMSIGGSRFGNYENQLPDGDYKECDINYHGGYRGAERIIYSDEGDVYYTEDHYKTFTKLY